MLRFRSITSLGLAVVLSLGTLFGADQPLDYEYTVNLMDLEKNRYEVSLECEGFGAETVRYNFPWIIPGTYQEANYGKFIHNFKAYDGYGDELNVKKDGKNTFVIENAADLVTVEYWVSATWEKPVLFTIWPMAGTGIIPERLFVINAGGVFGYFEGQELNPITLEVSYPDWLYPMTVLNFDDKGPGEVEIMSSDYHDLVDSPIMFAAPDTTSFMVQGTKVDIGYAHEIDDTPRAQQLKEALEPSMGAIDAFLDSLPAKKYDFIIYFPDFTDFGPILNSGRFVIPRALFNIMRHGVPVGGALEHNTSSFYYLPDFGEPYTDMNIETLEDIAIHEFMHILTPLNLRSQHIHGWNYNDPILSQHLWLYEGVTEYFSELIQVQGELSTTKDFLLRTMRNKIRRGERFPHEKMSFTEMSSNVLDKPYKRQYNQVYQRGAVIAMLLDIEIIRLTDGEKTLIDVMNELIAEYGPTRPFDEDTFFDVFTEKVHPDLRAFFSNYVEGREPLPYEQSFEYVGINYQAEVEGMFPRNPIRDNKVKNNPLNAGKLATIQKVGRKDWIGFKKGDQYDRAIYRDNYLDDLGNYYPEGSVVHFDVIRDGETITLSDTIKYIEKTEIHLLNIMADATPQQRRLFNIWLGYQEPGTGLIDETSTVNQLEIHIEMKQP